MANLISKRKLAKAGGWTYNMPEKGRGNMKKKEYQKARMELVPLSDADMDSVSGGVGNTEEEDPEEKNKIGTPRKEETEDFFTQGFMGTCSGYEQQGTLVQNGEDKEADLPDESRQDCFANGFMGMCSGYETQADMMSNAANQSPEQDDTVIVEDCITYGFMGMCSGYELAAGAAGK